MRQESAALQDAIDPKLSEFLSSYVIIGLRAGCLTSLSLGATANDEEATMVEDALVAAAMDILAERKEREGRGKRRAKK